MPTASAAPHGAVLHRLVVAAEPQGNVLLRLLEPFVIHDVLPHRIDCAAGADRLAVELEFFAAPDLAARLQARVAAMVPVRAAAIEQMSGRIDAAA